VAKTILSANGTQTARRVQLLSRHPNGAQQELKGRLSPDEIQYLEHPVEGDITKPETLRAAIDDADVVVSMVGLMHGKMEDFERIQWKGAENVARAAQHAGAKLIHISAIGANSNSNIPYARTKALGEDAVLSACPNATIIRPSIIFGPGDGFFAVSHIYSFDCRCLIFG
jgi:uncharacterized protein YbjT (DUF2867 family)